MSPVRWIFFAPALEYHRRTKNQSENLYVFFFQQLQQGVRDAQLRRSSVLLSYVYNRVNILYKRYKRDTPAQIQAGHAIT